MKRKASFLMGVMVFAASVLSWATPSVAAGATGTKSLVEFSLSGTAVDASPISFTLAPLSSDPGILGASGGAGYIEDLGSPFSTAIGGFALDSNTTGFYNTASGFEALTANDTGFYNTANGSLALTSNTSGNSNTASGFEALLRNTTGSFNEASGGFALYSNTTGSFNTAIGGQALSSNAIGRHNTAIGYYAGYQSQEGNFNIYLGSLVLGSTEDTNTIRIGKPYNAGTQEGQKQTFIAGIVGSALDESMEPAVVGITGEGRLGTMAAGLLPPGPKGDSGETGPPGPAGEGLISGSLLFLVSGATPPAAGYNLLGTYDFLLTTPGNKKPAKVTVLVYQKL